MFEVFLGETGIDKSWQADFEKEVKCIHCKEKARIAFVAFESANKPYEVVGTTSESVGIPSESSGKPFVCDLHKNNLDDKGDFWVHDCVAVAVYFCTKCGETTAIMNQG
jgi:hypothetical protein